MIPWRAIQKENFTKLEELIDFLQLSDCQREKLLKVSHFPLQLPRRLAEKMEKGRLDDPLFLQFVPLTDELKILPGYTLHPVEDQQFVKSCRLLQKYAGRALLLTTGACAMHCRYCFRQNYDYSGDKSFQSEIAAIADDTTLHEVILSGGDPLSLSDEALKHLIDQLDAIPHLKMLRFHSRFLIGIPERVTEAFLDMIRRCRLQVYFLLHCNHARELDSDILNAMRRIREAGAITLNQTVLLKGVNDSISALEELCLTLAENGILPYYLHKLDPVQGAAHFDLPTARGIELIEELRRRVPGYAVPRFVCEIPGEPSKTPIDRINVKF